MDILAFHRQGHSMRWIAKKLGIHRDTVKKYIFQKKQPQYRKQKRRESILGPYHQIIRDWLEQDDFRATWIFDKLKGLDYTGKYDTVRYFVRDVKKQKAQLAYIRFETEPGRQAQMDWADFKILNSDGSSSFIYLFALVLGFSRAMFAWFVDRCSLQAFMDSHIAAFHYLGGVPAETLYDNMRHVVITNTAGQRHFNFEFVDFAAHYGFTPHACPPYSPWVKGKVERPIDYIRESFWRGYHFESLEKANADLRRWLDTVANLRIHGTHRQPVSQRWQQERPFLGPLPAGDYDTSVKVFRKVYRDCQVSYETNRYLLPHQVAGKRIMLKIKDGTIRFFDDDQLLATYPVPEGRHQLVGNPLFYEQLKADRNQRQRKYGRNKGAATRGLSNASLFPQVMYRPLSDYDRLAQGGASWNS
ncbi:MAG: IS21 family transposase [Desulfobacterales bacterium]